MIAPIRRSSPDTPIHRYRAIPIPVRTPTFRNAANAATANPFRTRSNEKDPPRHSSDSGKVAGVSSRSVRSIIPGRGSFSKLHATPARHARMMGLVAICRPTRDAVAAIPSPFPAPWGAISATIDRPFSSGTIRPRKIPAFPSPAVPTALKTIGRPT